MAAICFVAKSAPTEARVISADTLPAGFETEVVPLVEIPTPAMPLSGMEPGDTFYVAARRRLRGQIWTWIGSYRYAIEIKGRPGSYVAGGILLPNEICPGEIVHSVLTNLDRVISDCLVDTDGRLRPNWTTIELAPYVTEFPAKSYQRVEGLRADGGLSPDVERLAYMGESNLPGSQLQFLFGALQTDRSLNSYSRIVFGASEQFSAKLFARSGLERLVTNSDDLPEVSAPAKSAPPSPPPRGLEAPGGPPLFPQTGASLYRAPEPGNYDRALNHIAAEQQQLRELVASQQRWLQRVLILALLVILGTMGLIALDIDKNDVLDKTVRHALDNSVLPTLVEQVGSSNALVKDLAKTIGKLVNSQHLAGSKSSGAAKHDRSDAGRRCDAGQINRTGKCVPHRQGTQSRTTDDQVGGAKGARGHGRAGGGVEKPPDHITGGSGTPAGPPPSAPNAPSTPPKSGS